MLQYHHCCYRNLYYSQKFKNNRFYMSFPLHTHKLLIMIKLFPLANNTITNYDKAFEIVSSNRINSP